MNKMLVQIIDNDMEWASDLMEECSYIDAFSMMSPVHAGNDAINNIEIHLPDILVLDLILPIYDGMYILEHISTNMTHYRPLVYVVSTMTATETKLMLSRFDIVSSYSIKPIKGIAVLQNIRHIIKALDIETKTTKGVGSLLTNKKPTREELVYEYLKKCGINVHNLAGRNTAAAMAACIEACKNGPIRLKNIYAQLAEHINDATAETIAQNVRYAINTAKHFRTPLFNMYFPDNGSLVSSKKFLSESANLLDMHMNRTDSYAFLNGQ